MFLLTVLARVDVLGIPASLNFFGNDKRKSRFGGLLSLVFFGFVIWTIYTSSIDLINRTNPKITVSKINHEEPRLINISNQAFPVAFVVQSSPIYAVVGFYDESIYTLQVLHRLIERVPQPDGSIKKVTTNTPLKTERCTKEHFGDYASSFKTFTFAGSYCVSQNQTNITKLRIQGNSASAINEAVVAKVVRCRNATSNGTCKTEAEINKWLGGAYFSMFYLNNLLNTEDYEHPTAKYRSVYTTIINPSSYKEARLDVGYLEVITDNGVLTETKESVNTLEISQVQELVDLNAHSNGEIAYLTLQSSPIETFHYRSYKKIQTVLAEVGSLANAFLMVLMFIIGPYLTLKSREALMRDIFDLGENSMKANPQNDKDNSKKRRKNKPGKSKTNSSNQGSVTKYTTIEVENPVLLSPVTLLSEPQPAQDTQWGDTPRNLFNLNRFANRNLKDLKLENLKVQTTRGEEFDTPRQYDTERKLVSVVDEVQDTQELNSTQKNNFTLKLPAYTRTLSPTSFSKSPLSSARKEDQSEKNQQTQLSYLTPKDDKKSVRKLITESAKLARINGEQIEEKDFDQMSYSSEGSEITIERHFNDLNGAVEENEIIEEPKSKESQQEKPVKAQQEQENIGEDDKEVKLDVEIEENPQEQKQEECQSDSKTAQNKRKPPKSNKKAGELQMWEYLLSFIWEPKPLKRKFEILNLGVNNINERLDVSNILRKFCEVDKLIALLLDSDQLELFNNMPKPRLHRPKASYSKQTTFEENIQKKISIVNSSNWKDTTKIKKSVSAISLRENKSRIDKRLLAIFEQESS